MITADKFQDEVPAGVAACRTDRAHDGLGAAVHQANLLRCGATRLNKFGELRLPFCRRPERETAGTGFLYRLYDLRAGVPQDARAPGADVVNKLIAVHVEDPVAGGMVNEQWCPAHSVEGANRRVHASWHEALGLGKQFFRPLRVQTHACSSFSHCATSSAW